MPQDDVIEPDANKGSYRKHRSKKISKEERKILAEGIVKALKEAEISLEPARVTVREIGASLNPVTSAAKESLNKLVNNEAFGQINGFLNGIREIGASVNITPIPVPINNGLLDSFNAISKGSSAMINLFNQQNAIKDKMANFIVPSINNLRPPDDFFKPKLPDISNFHNGKIEYYLPQRTHTPILFNHNSFDEDDDYISQNQYQEVKEYRHKGKDVKINSKPVISFNQKTKTLQIDEVTIKLKGKSRSTDICCAILKSKSKMKKIWAIDEIVEEIGEDIELKKPWPKLIYKSIYDLNRLIELEARIKNFIICTYESLQVNPEHL